MMIIPMNLREANAYIKIEHKHLNAVTDCKFCVGLQNDYGELCGVAICGRPASYFLDTGFNLEITRLCTNGEKNACSMLYGACIRAAKALGYRMIVTYTLESEDDAVLKECDFSYDGISGSVMLTGSHKRGNGVSQERKKRWIYELDKIR